VNAHDGATRLYDSLHSASWPDEVLKVLAEG
jgi:hypothetical protein